VVEIDDGHVDDVDVVCDVSDRMSLIVDENMACAAVFIVWIFRRMN
jgi:hypothetical protein